MFVFERFSWCDFVNYVAVVIIIVGPQFAVSCFYACNFFLQLMRLAVKLHLTTTLVREHAFVVVAAQLHIQYLFEHLFPSHTHRSVATLMYNNFSSTGFEWRYSIAFLVIYLCILLKLKGLLLCFCFLFV